MSLNKLYGIQLLTVLSLIFLNAYKYFWKKSDKEKYK